MRERSAYIWAEIFLYHSAAEKFEASKEKSEIEEVNNVQEYFHSLLTAKNFK